MFRPQLLGTKPVQAECTPGDDQPLRGRMERRLGNPWSCRVTLGPRARTHTFEVEIERNGSYDARPKSSSTEDGLGVLYGCCIKVASE